MYQKINVCLAPVCVILIFSTLLFAQSADAVIENEIVAKIIAEMEEINSEMAAELIEIYEATKRYEDVNVALEEGYIRDPFDLCDTGPMMGWPEFVGAMGVHYVRPDLLGLIPETPRVDGNGLHTDFMQPGILIYEPLENGTMGLVAIENLVFKEGWHAAGNEGRPEFIGYEYFAMADNPNTEVDEAHKFEPHYDLHMWLYKQNPSGLFMPFNPTVSCKEHVGN